VPDGHRLELDLKAGQQVIRRRKPNGCHTPNVVLRRTADEFASRIVQRQRKRIRAESP
jgi:hypothetical protein